MSHKFFTSIALMGIILLQGATLLLANDDLLYGIESKYTRVLAPIGDLSLEDIMERPRIQMFSVEKIKGYTLAHAQLNQMRAQYTPIAAYQGIIVADKDLKWLKGQIGPFGTKVAADNYAATLKVIFPQNQFYVISAETPNHSGFRIEGKLHTWA